MVTGVKYANANSPGALPALIGWIYQLLIM